MKTQSNTGVSITPDTRIGVLLDSYPQLEAALLELAPAFARLRNPILRKTVARITTVMQAAKIAGVPLSVMVNMLRQAAGQDPLGGLADDIAVNDNPRPPWVDPAKIVATLDARPLLDKGEHPAGLVIKELTTMAPDYIYELITPFEPVPLVEKAKALGFSVWSQADSRSMVRTFFARLK